MMECKKALVETDGDLEAAAELLRKKGQAKAEKKAGRIAAEGRVEIAANGSEVVVMEVNSETDFVAKDENFAAFARSAASLALSESPADVTTLMQASVAGGGTLEETRTTLIAKIGENISVRRFETISAIGSIGQYRHGERIGVVVDISGGDDELRKDIAMHIAASAPACIAEDNVPAEQLERERRILTEQAEQEGKPAEIVGKMVEGRLRKYLGEITLVGQSFVKDPDITVGKLLKQKGASVNAFARLEVGEGIEKKQEDFAAEVEAQVRASQNEDEKE
jgi:elongation factor Ts